MTNDSAKKVQGRGRLVAILGMLVPGLAYILVSCTAARPPSMEERQAMSGPVRAHGGGSGNDPTCNVCNKGSTPLDGGNVTILSDGGIDPSCLCIRTESTVTFTNNDHHINTIYNCNNGGIPNINIGSDAGYHADHVFNTTGTYRFSIDTKNCSSEETSANGTLEVATSTGQEDPADKRRGSR